MKLSTCQNIACLRFPERMSRALRKGQDQWQSIRFSSAAKAGRRSEEPFIQQPQPRVFSPKPSLNRIVLSTMGWVQVAFIKWNYLWKSWCILDSVLSKELEQNKVKDKSQGLKHTAIYVLLMPSRTFFQVIICSEATNIKTRVSSWHPC